MRCLDCGGKFVRRSKYSHRERYDDGMYGYNHRDIYKNVWVCDSCSKELTKKQEKILEKEQTKQELLGCIPVLILTLGSSILVGCFFNFAIAIALFIANVFVVNMIYTSGDVETAKDLIPYLKIWIIALFVVGVPAMIIAYFTGSPMGEEYDY